MSRGNRHFGERELAGLDAYAFHCRWRGAVAGGGVVLGLLAGGTALIFHGRVPGPGGLGAAIMASFLFALGLIVGGQRQMTVIEDARRGEGTPGLAGRLLWVLPMLGLLAMQAMSFFEAISRDAWYRLDAATGGAIAFAFVLGRFLALAWGLARFTARERGRGARVQPGKRVRPSGLRAHPARGVWRSREDEALPRRIRAVEGGRSLGAMRSFLFLAAGVGVMAGLVLTPVAHLAEHGFGRDHPTAPRSFFWAMRRNHFVARQLLEGEVRGPLAMLRCRDELVDHASWGGASWKKDVPTGPVGAVHDLALDMAETAGNAGGGAATKTVPVADAVGQGWTSLSLTSRAIRGGRTVVRHGLRRIVEADEHGWVELPVAMADEEVRSWEVDLLLVEPRGVVAWQLPEGLRAEEAGAGRWRIHGRQERLVADPVPLRLRWKLARPLGPPRDGVVPARAFDLGDGMRLVEVAPTRCGADRSPMWAFVRGELPADLGRIRIRRDDGAVLEELPLRLEPGVLSLPLPREEGEAFHALAGRAGGISALHLPLRFLEKRRRPLDEESLRRYHGDGIVIALLTPGFRAARRRANCRACFANQKTIAGALEMYNLDYSTDGGAKLPFVGVSEGGSAEPSFFQAPDRWSLSESGLARMGLVAVGGWNGHRSRACPVRKVRSLAPMLPLLKEQGYLQSVPQDTGPGEDTSHHYVLVDGNVACLRHGFIQPPGGISPNDRVACQFRLSGVQSPEVFAAIERAGARKSSGSTTRHAPLAILDMQFIWFLPLAVPLWRLGRWRHGIRRLVAGGAVVYLAAVFACALRPRPEAVHVCLAGYGLLFLVLLGAGVGQSLRLLRSRRVLDALFGAEAPDDEAPGPEAALVGKGLADEARWFGRLGRGAAAVAGLFLAAHVARMVFGTAPTSARGVFWFDWPGAIFGLVVLAASLASVAPAVASLVIRAGLTGSVDRRFAHVANGIVVLVPFGGLVLSVMEAQSRGRLEEEALTVAVFASFFAVRWLLLSRLFARMPVEAGRIVDGDPLARSAGSPAPDSEGLDLAPIRLELGDAACPVCAETFGRGDAVVFCACCSTPHHEDCWTFAGRCATFACRGTEHRPGGVVGAD